MQNKPRAESAHTLPYHLTINDLASEIFRCGRSKMFDLLKDEDLDLPGPVLVVGRDRLWSRDELLAWVAHRRPVEHNPRRAVVIEQTRPNVSENFTPKSPRKKPVPGPGSALIGFTPVSIARKAA